MKKLFSTIGIKTNTGITIAYLFLGIIFLIAAFIVKISDNPPGILLMFVG